MKTIIPSYNYLSVKRSLFSVRYQHLSMAATGYRDMT